MWWEEKEKENEEEQETRRAVKAIRVSGDRAISKSAHYMRELEALAKFSRPKVRDRNKGIATRDRHADMSVAQYAEFIVEFLGWYEVPGYLCIAMEFCEHGDLRKHLEIVKTMPEDQAKDVAFQVFAGLAMMHEAGLTHRDVKPAVSLRKVNSNKLYR